MTRTYVPALSAADTLVPDQLWCRPEIPAEETFDHNAFPPEPQITVNGLVPVIVHRQCLQISENLQFVRTIGAKTAPDCGVYRRCILCLQTNQCCSSQIQRIGTLGCQNCADFPGCALCGAVPFHTDNCVRHGQPGADVFI